MRTSRRARSAAYSEALRSSWVRYCGFPPSQTAHRPRIAPPFLCGCNGLRENCCIFRIGRGEIVPPSGQSAGVLQRFGGILLQWASTIRYQGRAGTH